MGITTCTSMLYQPLIESGPASSVARLAETDEWVRVIQWALASNQWNELSFGLGSFYRISQFYLRYQTGDNSSQVLNCFHEVISNGPLLLTRSCFAFGDNLISSEFKSIGRNKKLCNYFQEEIILSSFLILIDLWSLYFLLMVVLCSV